MSETYKKFVVSPENPDGILVDLTDEEKTARDEEIANAETLKANEETEKTNLENLKASAKTKLMNGEALTEDEANVMVGL